MAALATLEFTFIYNDFLWALILVPDQSKQPITAALNNLQGEFFTDNNLLAAGALLTAVPTVLVFVVLQRHFVNGLTLGASRLTTFRRITLPLVLPGVIGSALFGFTLSFDEFARSFFSTGSEQTLPLVIYAQFDRQLQPTLYALGTLTTVVSLLAVGSAIALLRYSGRRTLTSSP